MSNVWSSWIYPTSFDFIKQHVGWYCGIIIVRGKPMFVAFVDNPCPLIYIPTNVYKSICLILIKIIPNLLPTKFWLPMNIDPHKQKRFHSNSISVYPVLINMTMNMTRRIRLNVKSKSMLIIGSRTIYVQHFIAFQ